MLNNKPPATWDSPDRVMAVYPRIRAKFPFLKAEIYVYAAAADDEDDDDEDDEIVLCIPREG
jgi:hypothetical protein